MKECFREHAVWRIEKFADDEAYREGRAYEVLEFEGNLLLNEGINEILSSLADDAAGAAFDNSNAHIGVGDGSSAAAASQTGLQGSTKTYVGMETGYPIYGSSQQMIFRSEFDGDTGNHAWNEFTVANGSSDSATNLNRKVSDQGTKALGQTWTITLTLTLT